MPKLKRLIVEAKYMDLGEFTEANVKVIAPDREDLIIELSYTKDCFYDYITTNLGDFGYKSSAWRCEYRNKIFCSFIFGQSSLEDLEATLQAEREIGRAEQDTGLVMDMQSSYPNYICYLRETQQKSEAKSYKKYRWSLMPSASAISLAILPFLSVPILNSLFCLLFCEQNM